MGQNLVIVESPAKANTIQKYLGKNYNVQSCYGHIRDLPKKGLAIDVDNDFAQKYEVPADKKEVVKGLTKLAQAAPLVYLASDEDREGEAISWHLFEALKLEKDKTKRIVFHEITKQALAKAIKNPREIDENLVKAQQTRRVLDRLVGFELSPVLWKKIRPNLSAGRVQSVAVRLVVEREKQINDFKITYKYKVSGLFSEKGKEMFFKATLNKDFAEKKATQQFLQKCIGAIFSLEDITIKKGKKSPPPPYITSTLQQDASRKLGFQVGFTMSLSQKLYEAGYITYMRTDSVNLSEEALQGAKKVIGEKYGDEYHKWRVYKTKSTTAQEAHEAIRPTDFGRETVPMDNAAQKLYTLIRKRALASQMADAQIETTTFQIGSNNIKEKFISKGEVIIFDGFLKLYTIQSENDEDENDAKNQLPKLTLHAPLTAYEIVGRQKFDNHPSRYTEGSLVKKLEEIGVGRPSTYAPTISTIQKRNYIENESREGKERKYVLITLKDEKLKEEQKTEIYGAEKKKFFPTDTGILVNRFLTEHFDGVVDYNFTAKLEEEFDQIASGEKEWISTLKNFYNPFHGNIEKANEMERVSSEKFIGVDPDTGKNIFGRITKYGPCVQLGNMDDKEKPKFASLQKGQSLETITLEQALQLFKLPRHVGDWDENPITASIGRFGPYLKINNSFVSIPKEHSVYDIDLETAIDVIKAKREADAKKVIHDFSDEGIKVLNGRFGPYITFEKENYKIPKKTNPESLTATECMTIIQEQKDNPKPGRKIRRKK